MTRLSVALLTLLLFFSAAGVQAEEAAKPSLLETVLQGHRLVENWQIAEARALSQSLLKEHPESGDVHYLDARVEFFRGNYGHAAKILKRIDSKEPSLLQFKKRVEATRDASTDFISRETEHFIFRFVDGPNQVLLPFAEEVMERSYEVLGDLFQYRPEEKVLIEFYPDRNSLAEISPLTRQDINTSGTVALCKYNRIMMISPASLVRGYNWMDTLSHEYIHFLLTSKSQNNVPLWLHEGIAKHFETHWRNGAGALPPVMESTLARGLKSDYLIPLDSMMPSFAKLKTQEDVQLAYSQVSVMVDYMVTLKGSGIVAQLLTDLSQGKEFEKTLEERLGMNLPTFQERWKQFAKDKNLRIISGLQAIKTKFKEDTDSSKKEKDYSEVGPKRSQDLTFLGDILKSRNQFQAAILEYQKAYDETLTRSPILFNKLAGTYIIIKNYEEAEKLLKISLSYYPTFHTTLTNLGQLYFETERYESAKNYFEQALRINPFNPFVHQRLINVYSQLGLSREREYQSELYGFIQ